MSSGQTLSLRCRLYVVCVVLAGSAAIADAIYRLIVNPIPHSWVVLAALTLFSGSFAIRVPSIPATISVSETFVFTAVLLFGTAPGTIIVALDGLIISLWRRKRDLHRVLFNSAEPAISIWVASHIFFYLSGIRPFVYGPNDITSLVLPLVAFTAAYFLLNSWLTAIAVSLETGVAASQLWRKHFLWLSLNYFGGASVAFLLARNTSTVDFSALSVIIPLLVISYLTFKTALQRMDEARLHVEQLNSLYLSTIETFAMWIDAKDQVTHGHIRRVQIYAIALAKQLGVKDERLLKAIEAASLLHDMGKLAVPEHILNKPGKLTTGEFERMKLHASVGAEILSAIDFPYPVVPIVRHHHENWDGTGYPDRISGMDIPIGARILAVVDCFDALTSDRPYRPALPDEEALAILRERRGTMYDPIVVDTFLRVHDQVQQSGALKELEVAQLPVSLTSESQSHFSPDELGANPEAVLSLYELAKSLAGHAGVEDTGAVIAKHLTELVPAPMTVLFTHQQETDELAVAYASGLESDALRHRRLTVGVGVSGWVAANNKAATRSDPSLELSRLGVKDLPYRKACSFPLSTGSSIIGVLTMYADAEPVFTDERVRTVELLIPHVSRAVAKAIEYDRDQRLRLHDQLTGLPHFAALSQLVAVDGTRSSAHPLVVVFLDVHGFRSVVSRLGPAAGDAVLMHVTDVIRNTLRSGDLLLRYGGDEFVALLTESDLATAEAVALRISTAVSSTSFVLSDGTPLSVRLMTGHAIAPLDGSSLEDLVAVARHRAAEGFGEPREHHVVH